MRTLELPSELEEQIVGIAEAIPDGALGETSTTIIDDPDLLSDGEPKTLSALYRVVIEKYGGENSLLAKAVLEFIKNDRYGDNKRREDLIVTLINRARKIRLKTRGVIV